MSTVAFPPSPSSASKSATPRKGSTTVGVASPRSPFTSPTRTIAILSGPCAKVHRLTIESNIVAAGFDVLLSREEEWSYPDDVDFLYEFLQGHSDEAVRYWVGHLTGAPIYLMVLERMRAVETWLELIGPGEKEGREADNEEEEEEEETSFSKGLRLSYGKGSIYGSSDRRQAQRQIAVCAPELASEEALNELHQSFNHEADESFADSQIELSGDDSYLLDGAGSVLESETSQVIDSPGGDLGSDGEGTGAIPGTNYAQRAGHSSAKATVPRDHGSQQQQSIFRARPMPASLACPTLQPRLSRAAALRMGVEFQAAPSRGSKNDAPLSHVPVGISGRPKADVPPPKSLAEPSIKPRANRASLARIGGGGQPVQPTYQRPRKEVDFSNTPGHRRINTISSVPSLAQPTIPPRQNRASLARLGAGTNPNRVEIFRHRTLSMGSVDSTPASVNSGACEEGSESRTGASRERRPVDFSNTPGHRRDLGPSNLASLKPPTITPRTNKAAAARGGVVAGSIVSSTPAASTKANSFQSHLNSSLRANGSASNSSGRASPLRNSRTISSDRTPSNAAQSRERKPVDFSNTPGHKKSGSFSIASLATPKIQPRLNNAASRRMSIGGADNSGRSGVDLLPSRPGSALAGRTSSLGMNAPLPPMRPASSAGVRRADLDLAPHQDLEIVKRCSAIKLKGITADGAGTMTRSDAATPLRGRGPPPSSYRAPSTQVA